MDDLADFLQARLDEDEWVALAVGTGPNSPEKWTASQYREGVRPWRIDGQCSLVVEAVCGPDAAHVVRHDPARVLREVEAKRRIVDRYAWLREHGDTGGAAWVLPLLAAPYAAHPDYRPEWAPRA